MHPVNPRRRRLVWSALVLLLLFASVLAIRQAGVYLEAPAQAAVKSDLILCLGGEIGERSEKAAELYRAGYAKSVLVTGFAGLQPEPRRHFLHWRLEYLQAQGIPAEALLIDATSSNTYEEAVNTLKMMRERGWQRVLVVSEPPHLRRLSWTWAQVFEGSGREYRLIASPMTEWHADTWWRDERSGIFVIDEYLKIVYHLVKLR